MKWFVVLGLEAWMKKNDFSVENGERHLSSCVIYPLVNTIVIIEHN